MASLLPPAPPPEIPKQDKRSLPPHIRQEIVDLHTQYPAFRPHEIATICFVKFNRKPAPATIKLILASSPKPSTTERRHPRSAEIESGKERRRLVIRLHVDGWNAKRLFLPSFTQRFAGTAFLKSWSQIMAVCSFPMTPGGYARSSAREKRDQKRKTLSKLHRSGIWCAETYGRLEL